MKTFATKQKWPFIALIALLSISLSACIGQSNHEWLEAPGWGRARLIGETESAYPVQPALDDQGNSYFALNHIESNIPIIEVIALDVEANPLWQTQIPLERLKRARKPTVILTADGLKAYWIMDASLFSARLDLDGNLLGAPQRVSGSHTAIYYETAVDPDGNGILWFSGDRANSGLYAVDAVGNIENVDFYGYKAQIAFDSAGGLHATWLQNRPGDIQYSIYYAYYPDGKFIADQEAIVFSPVMAITGSLLGPELGLDDNQAYIFWTELSRTGFSAGEVTSLYTSLPYDSQETGSERRVAFPSGYGLNYSTVESWLQAGERALPAEQSIFATPDLIDIYANPLGSDELVIAFSSRQPYLRNKEATQVGLIFLKDNSVNGYQLLSFNPAQSELPAVRSDSQGYLYATWLEQTQSGELRLYYASTAPETRAALNNLTRDDVIHLTVRTLFGMLSGMVLLFLPMLWMIGPIFVYVITGPLRQENESITAPGTLLTLLAGVAAYWMIKLNILPGIATYVPFSAWLPILPESLFEVLRIGMPILISLIAFYYAWRSTYAKSNTAPLFFLLIFSAVDGILSLAIYGTLFYNAL